MIALTRPPDGGEAARLHDPHPRVAVIARARPQARALRQPESTAARHQAAFAVGLAVRPDALPLHADTRLRLELAEPGLERGDALRGSAWSSAQSPPCSIRCIDGSACGVNAYGNLDRSTCVRIAAARRPRRPRLSVATLHACVAVRRMEIRRTAAALMLFENSRCLMLRPSEKVRASVSDCVSARANRHRDPRILLGNCGEPRRNRTFNPQIKSLLLCQLS